MPTWRHLPTVTLSQPSSSAPAPLKPRGERPLIGLQIDDYIRTQRVPPVGMDSGAWRGFPFDWYPPAPVLVFPFPPMLAALKHSLPIGDQWLYEPKLDGFRGLLRQGQMATDRCSVETFAISRPRFLNWYRRPPLCPLGRCWTANSWTAWSSA